MARKDRPGGDQGQICFNNEVIIPHASGTSHPKFVAIVSAEQLGKSATEVLQHARQIVWRIHAGMWRGAGNGDADAVTVRHRA